MCPSCLTRAYRKDSENEKKRKKGGNCCPIAVSNLPDRLRLQNDRTREAVGAAENTEIDPGTGTNAKPGTDGNMASVYMAGSVPGQPGGQGRFRCPGGGIRRACEKAGVSDPGGCGFPLLVRTQGQRSPIYGGGVSLQNGCGEGCLPV